MTHMRYVGSKARFRKELLPIILADRDPDQHYVEPPYDSTLQYRSGTFDSEAFWVWCDELIQLGHQVFVSEYSAPDHWKCVWQREVTNSLTADTGAKRGIERLFSCTRG